MRNYDYETPFSHRADPSNTTSALLNTIIQNKNGRGPHDEDRDPNRPPGTKYRPCSAFLSADERGLPPVAFVRHISVICEESAHELAELCLEERSQLGR